MLRILSIIFALLVIPAVALSAPLRPACSGGNTTVTICDSGCDYTTLALAEAGEDDDANISDECNLHFEVHDKASADTTEVSFAGWTTAADKRIKIHSNSTVGTSWDTSKYELTVSAAVAAIWMDSDNMDLYNIQIQNTGAGWAVRTKANNIHNGIFWGNSSTAEGVTMWGTGATAQLYNSIVIAGASSSGCTLCNAGASGVWHINNTTCYSGSTGFNNASGCTIVYNNNIVQGTSGNSYGVGSGTNTGNYNISDDTTIPSGSNNQQNITLSFVGGGDYALHATDTEAYDCGNSTSGCDNPESGLFSDDIETTTRDTQWEIGAWDEGAVVVEICNNSIDDDADTFIDCADSDCDTDTGPSGETCEYGTELSCTDTYDNDADGNADCLDSDCAADPACIVSAVPFNGSRITPKEFKIIKPWELR